MLLIRDSNHGEYEIKSYEPGMLKINDTYYKQSILLGAHELRLWQPQTFKDLTVEDLALIMPLNPNVILLGTGTQLIFPDPKLLSQFYSHKIGFEVMTTLSACHTFNVLMSEGRNVVAALLIR